MELGLKNNVVLCGLAELCGLVWARRMIGACLGLQNVVGLCGLADLCGVV